jgi:hypothetical protein
MNRILAFLNRRFGKKNDGSQFSDFWLQKLAVKKVYDRESVFRPFIEDKKVLHIGCTDYPVFNPNSNLHLTISKYVRELHGMDVDENGIKELSNHFNGIYFSRLKDAMQNEYDTVLVPETIEHVDNVQLFLSEIDQLKAQTFIITGPNAFQKVFDNCLNEETGIFTEAIHPDHNCWYSPYTLKNVIERFTSLKVDEIYLCLNEIMIVCVCSKKV